MFLDKSGANLVMGRSHAWLPRGTELIEPRPMNWGTNLTLVGAFRGDRLLTLATSWDTMNTAPFKARVRRRLVRHLRRGDVEVMDNLGAPKTGAVRHLIEQAGATVRFLPPYSYDFNPIEPAWALIKAHPCRRATNCRRDRPHRAARAARRPVSSLPELVRSRWLSTQVIYGTGLGQDAGGAAHTESPPIAMRVRRYVIQHYARCGFTQFKGALTRSSHRSHPLSE